LSRENAGCQIATRTHYLKPLPFILRSIEVNDFRKNEVMDGTISMQRTILYYQDAIEKPVEDNTDDLKIRMIMGTPRIDLY